MSAEHYIYFCNQTFILKSVQSTKRVINFFIVLCEKSPWLFDTSHPSKILKVSGVKLKINLTRSPKVSGFVIEKKSAMVSHDPLQPFGSDVSLQNCSSSKRTIVIF